MTYGQVWHVKSHSAMLGSNVLWREFGFSNRVLPRELFVIIATWLELEMHWMIPDQLGLGRAD